MIEVYLPDENTEKLPNQVKPHGWEHLAGPFSWCEPAGDIIYEDDDCYLPVEVKNNTMGTIARHFQENGEIPHSNILFVGPPGNGKSAVEKLLAWTHLSETHAPVTYDGGGITLIDHETREPFVINPTDEGTITYDYVDRKLSESVLPEEVGSATRLQLHNASDSEMNKAAISDLKNDLKRDLSMIGRRVVVISEIHDFIHGQARGLKNEIDPPNIPDGLLLLADANSKSKANQALGDAGMERFEVVSASQWHTETLRHYASRYLDHYQISFSGFEDLPEQVLAERAEGSIRQLLFHIQKIRDATQPVTPSDLTSLLEKQVDEGNYALGQDLWKFQNKVVPGNITTDTFVTNMIQRDCSVHTFLKDLSTYLSTQYPSLMLNRDVNQVLVELREACHYTLHEGPPVNALIWASVAEPLEALAEIMHNSRQ